jgi:hypothetical protein
VREYSTTDKSADGEWKDTDALIAFELRQQTLPQLNQEGRQIGFAQKS